MLVFCYWRAALCLLMGKNIKRKQISTQTRLFACEIYLTASQKKNTLHICTYLHSEGIVESSSGGQKCLFLFGCVYDVTY